ncbi:hypothetical protein DFH11DRAFT_75205 [Phellopilus nigrolimitatus]|nr:hypothetical protein DFH11DRAFT_75205 [Phellopilus nigrolimitatus]
MLEISNDHLVIDTMSLTDFTQSAIETASGDTSALNTLAVVLDLRPESLQTPNRHDINLDVSSLSLVLGNTDSPASLELVADLVASARTTANAHFCASVLAGHATESDEYGDVGIWIIDAGNIDTVIGASNSLANNARMVLKRLGLDTLLSTEDAEATPLVLASDTSLPAAFKGSSQETDVAHLSGLLAQLENRFAFSVNTGRGGIILHFLLGQPRGRADDSNNANVWAGLLGVGVWAD